MPRFPVRLARRRHTETVRVALPPPDHGAESWTTVAAETPPGAPAGRCEAPPEIPDFEIVRELGRGGMGVVYEARQRPLGRTVALKVLRGPALDDPDRTRRFLAEAETLARVGHPNIVQVYAVGDHDGRAYLALEHVAGGNLADRLDRLGPPPPEVAARLEITLARAVHAAHDQGVLHRDLKPANVLLTADGSPKVADFGIAKGLDADLTRTRDGHLCGTPAYVAPESLDGSATLGVGADVYSLGVVLYELLTGHPPFQLGNAADFVDQVRHAEPIPPAYWRRGVPRDLETICLKCLRKRPAERYATAAALADDLERFLAGKPIAARPVGALERGWRLCRRHPAIAALSAAVLLLAMASGTGLALAHAHLRSEQEATKTALARADARRSQAQAALDATTSVVVDDVLGRQTRLREEHRKLLADVARLYEGLAADPGDSPAERTAAAAARMRLGDIHRRLGHCDVAEAAYRDAAARFAALAETTGAPDRRLDVATARMQLASMLADRGDATGAIELLTVARDDAAWLAARDDAPEQAVRLLAKLHNNLASLRGRTGKPEEAVAEFRAAADGFGRLLAVRADDRAARLDLAGVTGNLGLQLHKLRRPHDAEAPMRTSAALFEELLRRDPRDGRATAGLAEVRLSLANLLGELRRFDEGIAEAKLAHGHAAALVAAFPSVPSHALTLGGVLCDWGRLLVRNGDASAALDRYDQSVAILHPLADRMPDIEAARRFLSNARHGRALALDALGRPHDAAAERAAAPRP